MNLDLGYQTQMWLGLTEREVFPYLRACIGKAKTGIDIGCAEGEYTLLYLAQPQMKKVLAFDPFDRFPKELQENMALNGFTNDPRLSAIKKFVSERDEEGHCTLDTVAADLEGPFIVKIDAEGAETDVLRGAPKMMARKDVYWIIETHALDKEQQCDEMLRSKGMTTRIIKHAWWRTFLPEFRTMEHNRWMAAWSE
ncbi:MAG: hypothetical protein M3O30_04555 [Planctomycetota bacterium]|nr:hypothetical protein [Planctomycetota bacterium]